MHNMHKMDTLKLQIYRTKVIISAMGLIMMCATQLNLINPIITTFTVRARGVKFVLLKSTSGIQELLSLVTVYPYNGYIKSTNPVVRHVMSLTCTLKRMN